uniref:Nucleolar complex protein 3 homolog n=1 Tax=Amphilophus citrinellus TaxID=61819 RepID=A0A3Q0T398_AMPCI
MGPPRSKKRRPTFRRLLKTSGVKLENKLKNRQLKQQNVAKKQRKEQKRLRQAVKGAAGAVPRPLETYRKRPEEEEDEEEFLESLPTDMLEEDNLQQMTVMARQASFVTRDLSSCGPVHGGKKRKSDVVPADQSHWFSVTVEETCAEMTPAQRERLRDQKLNERKLTIASLASAIVSDPFSSIKRVKELRAMLMEADPSVAVTVRKLAMISLMEVFKDIAPTYRIRPLTSAEKATKVKKETQVLREFEEGLVSQYKFYLEDLEQTIKDWKQKKKKRSQAVAFQSYGGLAEVAVRCLCELLVALPHFNFHNNIIVILVPLMNDPVKKVSVMCCDALGKLFQQDKEGGASLATVRVISGLVKSLNYNVRPELLRTLLSLRIKEVEVKKDIEAMAPKQKFMTNKEKKKNLSRMQRKHWKKAEEKLEKELLETEASESKDKKIKLVTLNMMSLPCSFAHLINLEFFDDLLNVLQDLIQSGDLSTKETLHCIQTVFTILSGQGDVLNIDPLNFYSQFYKLLLRLHAGASSDDTVIVLRCLDAMLTRRRKQVTLQRAMAFVKRLSTISLHMMPNASVGILAANRATMHAFSKCDFLLDNEIQGSGFYLPELDEPEYCNAQNTALWELHTLQRHYHPVVRRFAVHLSQGAPSEGSSALSVELSRRSPVELFDDYSIKQMTFNPPVASPSSKKKDHFAVGAALLDAELQRRIESALTAAEDAKLDFTAAHTQPPSEPLITS